MATPPFAPMAARRPLLEGTREAPPANLRTHGPKARGREVAALLLGTLGIFLALALASYRGSPAGLEGVDTTSAIQGANWVGPVGQACARGLVLLVGWVAWAVPVELLLLSIPFVTGKPNAATPARLAGDILLVVVGAALIQVGDPTQLAFGRHSASGLVGELFGELGRSLFSTIGSFLVGFACLGLILIARAAFSFILLVRAIGRWSAKGALGTAAGAKTVADAWKTARELEREKSESARAAARPRIDLDSTHDDAIVVAFPTEAFDAPADGAHELVPMLDGPTPPDEPPTSTPKKRSRRRKEESPAAPVAVDAPSVPPPVAPPPGVFQAVSVPCAGMVVPPQPST